MDDGYKSVKCMDYLVDGFPRNDDNRDCWERVLGTKTVIKRVLFVDCPDEVGANASLSFGNPLDIPSLVRVCILKRKKSKTRIITQRHGNLRLAYPLCKQIPNCAIAMCSPTDSASRYSRGSLIAVIRLEMVLHQEAVRMGYLP